MDFTFKEGRGVMLLLLGQRSLIIGIISYLCDHVIYLMLSLCACQLPLSLSINLCESKSH